jgi:hypothetical protein
MGAYDPYEHAGKLGVRVIRRKLTTGTGPWAPDINTVFIQERMHRVHERSALAHELGHRDDRPKHEVAADRYAANNMVDPEHLVDLTRWSPDMSRWAHEMGVSARLIRVYWNLHRVDLAVA